jgi:putative hydroxymethylpyrimidine transporter CytX
MTGGLIAPLGLKKGIAVILIGHFIGCIILALTGLIGFWKNQPALKSSRLSFGRYGSYIISVFNIIQLIGWTAIMLIQCAGSLSEITKELTGFAGVTVFIIAVGILVAVWAIFADKGVNVINSVAVALLFLLCLVILCMIMAKGGRAASPNASGGISAGSALELSIVMPLTWLPMISDYTMHAKSAKSSFWGSFLGYFTGSSFMYIIGLVSCVFTNAQDFAGVIIRMGLGAVGLLVVVLATLTTTYLDVYSAVMSTLNITGRMSKRLLIVIISAVGTVAALVFPMEQYENFLYAIGSVFAPVFSIVLTDYFILKADRSVSRINPAAIISAAAGTASYYLFVRLDWIVGSTVPSMAISAAIYLILRLLINGFKIKPNVEVKENDCKNCGRTAGNQG